MSRPKFEECAGELRRLHGLGYSDGDVARALGVCRSAAGTWRNRLGLPANGPNGHPHVRATFRQKLKEQLYRTHYKCLRDIRTERDRVAAARDGWPGASPTEARILTALEAAGRPLAPGEVAALVGLKTPTRFPADCQAGILLRRLVGRRMVTRVWAVVWRLCDRQVVRLALFELAAGVTRFRPGNPKGPKNWARTYREPARVCRVYT